MSCRSRPIRRRSASAAARARAWEARSWPSSRPGLDREQGRRRGCVDELGILRERVVGVERRHGHAVARDFEPLPPGTLGRLRELPAGSVAEVPRVRVPVAKPKRGIVESLRHDRVPASGRRPVRELAQELAERLAGEEVGLHERDRESEREQDPHADEQPGKCVERALAHPDHEHGEVEDEQRGHEQQRGRSDLGERPPLRSRGGAEAPDPDGGDAGDHGEPDVGDERRHLVQHLGFRRDQEGVLGAGGAANGERTLAGEHGREKQRGAEEEGQDEDERREQPAVGGVPEPAGRKGEAEVQAHGDQGRRPEGAEAVDGRHVRSLP